MSLVIYLYIYLFCFFFFFMVLCLKLQNDYLYYQHILFCFKTISILFTYLLFGLLLLLLLFSRLIFLWGVGNWYNHHFTVTFMINIIVVVIYTYLYILISLLTTWVPAGSRLLGHDLWPPHPLPILRPGLFSDVTSPFCFNAHHTSLGRGKGTQQSNNQITVHDYPSPCF